MAYKNTIISLATLLAFGTACSKAPSYSKGVQSAATEQSVDETTNDPTIDIPHGEAKPSNPTVATAEPKKEEPAAKPVTPPAATVLTAEQKAKIIADRGFVAYAVNAPTGQGWNTEATPFLIGQTVNAAGAIDTAKPVTVYFCNFSAGQMRLHSESGNGPMQHGAAFAGLPTAVAASEMPAKQEALDKASLAEIQAMANCRAHAVSALGSVPGATYNHNGGSAGNVASRVFFKIYTVDAAGVVAAK
jgi:hypothetical protein